MKKVQQFVDNIGLAAVVTTYNADDPLIVAANYKHEKLTGFQEPELVGRNPKLFKGPATDGMKSWQIKEAIKSGDHWHGTIINYKKDGTAYNVEITIFGIVVGDQKFYIALKRGLSMFDQGC